MTATPENNSEAGGGDVRSDAISQRAERVMSTALKRARAAILWERVWPAMVALSVAFGLFLIASWLGLWLALPTYGRIAGLVVFAAILMVALLPALGIRAPGDSEALSRLDRESRLPHRPATALSDHLASRPDDPVGAALWRAHISRMSSQMGALRAGLPSPRIAAVDPQAVRALVLLGVIATFFMAPGDHMRRIAAAFDFQTLVPPTPYRIDAWVTPPAYTGRAPVMLPGLRSEETAQTTASSDKSTDRVPTYDATAMTVPGGSELVVRVTGLPEITPSIDGGIALAPEEETDQGPEKQGPEKTAAPAASATKAPAGGEQRYIISADGSARITGPDGRSVSWHFRALPDTAPTIEMVKDVLASGRTGIQLAYKVEDDYGVLSAQAAFTPVPSPPPLHALKNVAPKPAPKVLVAAPDFALPLPGGRSKAGTGQTTKDLTESPWAGQRVTMTLTAKDEAGNVGHSKPHVFTLPARVFNNPLSRSLIEQRRILALDANERERVEAALDALAIAPERFTPDAAHYMGLRSVYYRLSNASSDDDLRGVVDYLWEVAVRIEDGALSDVEKKLRDAQEKLQSALENGASDEEIKRLAQELRDAMQEFMQALAQQAQQNGDTAQQQPMDPNTRTVRPQDLQKMLDRIEDMAKNGARDAARQMLSELQNMLNGLQAGRQQQRRQQGQSQMSQNMDQLGDMIRKQQKLRDRTFKEGREPGQQGEQGEQSFNDLKQNQEQLRDQLRKLREKMQQAQRGKGQQGQKGEGQQGEQGQGEQGQNGQGQQGEGGEGGQPGDGGLGEAEQAMREAEQALGQGDGTGAVDAQSEALQALRKGAQQMAEAMQQQQGPGGEPGSPSGEMADRNDPLGRPMRSRDYGDDVTVKVPDEIDMQRARRVLEELRRRFGEPERPRMELDYLERLLRDF